MGWRALGIVCFVTILAAGLQPTAHAVSLDKTGDIKLGVRSYTAVRIGSEHTDDNSTSAATETFPSSAAGHLRQHRYFVEAEWDHNLKRLIDEGFGPLELLNHLPFKLSELRYHLVYRGEGEGIYDYGPREFRTAEQFKAIPTLPLAGVYPDGKITPEQVASARRRLRRLGVQRQRLFQAFLDVQAGPLFVRFGRQILSWGETDNFRLLDNINPLDSSFGGFLVSLDERRVPLDMLRANYFLGHLGPISDAYIEMYAAIDRRWGAFPGTPVGSPWALPSLGAPNPLIHSIAFERPRTIENTRGGGQLKFNVSLPGVGSTTMAVAHYYTYFDNPTIRVTTSTVPLLNILTQAPAPVFDDGAAVHPLHIAQRVQVTGATATFVIPARYARKIGLAGEPVIRSEFAYFNDEPRFRQSELDPIHFSLDEGRQTGRRRVGDSVNFVLGIDHNQFIRWLNPRSSFLFSTQFFYKHLNGATKRGKFRYTAFASSEVIDDGEVLPVTEESVFINFGAISGAVQPRFVHHPVDQYLQTLNIGTSYWSGQLNPNLTLFYDWSGSFVAAPSVTYIRDPFRFVLQYNYLEAGRLRGASGTSLLRDRDNVLFQVEYVI